MVRDTTDSDSTREDSTWQHPAHADATRRRFVRTGAALAGGLALGVGAAGGAAARPGKPSFGPEIYGDGEAWGTKFTTALPEPTTNEQSFDVLAFVVAGPGRAGPPVQLPISEAAPGNPDYNGGRWASRTVVVTDADRYDEIAPVTDYETFLAEQAAGTFGPFQDGAPIVGGSPIRPEYFQCPLLPVK